MRRGVFVAVVGLLVSLAACRSDGVGTDSPVVGPELVANGGFEHGSAGADMWEVSVGEEGQAANVVDDGSGNRVVALAGSLLEDVGWPQAVSNWPFQVEADARYRLSLRARSDGFGLVIPIVWFMDAAGVDLTGSGPGAWEVDSSNWTDYDFEFKAPEEAETAYVLFRLALNTALTSEPLLTVEVDDISVRRLGH